MGLNILLPFVQDANPIIAGDQKLVHMKYFFTRKLMFVKECDAVVCLPGGFGTLDEAMEVLTLNQTGKHDPIPVVFLDAPGGTYWSSFNEFIQTELLDGEMISPDDTSLYMVTDDCQAAVEKTVNFYRVYDSMRYVGNQLVLRLKKPLGDNALQHINQKFKELVVDGGFKQTDALLEEKNEPELFDLKRLVFQFDRRNLAKLRLMIDFINTQ